MKTELDLGILILMQDGLGEFFIEQFKGRIAGREDDYRSLDTVRVLNLAGQTISRKLREEIRDALEWAPGKDGVVILTDRAHRLTEALAMRFFDNAMGPVAKIIRADAKTLESLMARRADNGNFEDRVDRAYWSSPDSATMMAVVATEQPDVRGFFGNTPQPQNKNAGSGPDC
jgi:hypothetical protein